MATIVVTLNIDLDDTTSEKEASVLNLLREGGLSGAALADKIVAVRQIDGSGPRLAALR